jgi:hypothetical protein
MERKLLFRTVVRREIFILIFSQRKNSETDKRRMVRRYSNREKKRVIKCIVLSMHKDCIIYEKGNDFDGRSM